MPATVSLTRVPSPVYWMLTPVLVALGRSTLRPYRIIVVARDAVVGIVAAGRGRDA